MAVVKESGRQKNTLKGERTRNYVTVVYPDSAPVGWENILSEQHVRAFISPLHSKDVNPGGESKKPHWHVLVMFDSVKTIRQARYLFSKINGVGCEAVHTLRGAARYLCHLDDPNKAQYDTSDVICLNGADYISICSSISDKYRMIREMITFCEDNKILSFSYLIQYSMIERPDWFRSLCDNSTFVIKEYLKSKKWELEVANKSSSTYTSKVE